MGINLVLLKTCSKCGNVKPWFDFRGHRKTDTAWCSDCRNKGKQYNDKWLKSQPPDSNRLRVLEYYKNNKEKEVARVRRWGEKNHNKVLKYKRNWRVLNPETMNENVHRRRARINGAGGSYTRDEWKSLCDRFGNKCLSCGAKTKLEPDHIIPISKGGTNSIDNIQPLCRSCNQKKFTKTIDYRK